MYVGAITVFLLGLWLRGTKSTEQCVNTTLGNKQGQIQYLPAAAQTRVSIECSWEFTFPRENKEFILITKFNYLHAYEGDDRIILSDGKDLARQSVFMGSDPLCIKYVLEDQLTDCLQHISSLYCTPEALHFMQTPIRLSISTLPRSEISAGVFYYTQFQMTYIFVFCPDSGDQINLQSEDDGDLEEPEMVNSTTNIIVFFVGLLFLLAIIIILLIVKMRKDKAEMIALSQLGDQTQRRPTKHSIAATTAGPLYGAFVGNEEETGGEESGLDSMYTASTYSGPIESLGDQRVKFSGVGDDGEWSQLMTNGYGSENGRLSTGIGSPTESRRISTALGTLSPGSIGGESRRSSRRGSSFAAGNDTDISSDNGDGISRARSGSYRTTTTKGKTTSQNTSYQTVMASDFAETLESSAPAGDLSSLGGDLVDDFHVDDFHAIYTVRHHDLKFAVSNEALEEILREVEPTFFSHPRDVPGTRSPAISVHGSTGAPTTSFQSDSSGGYSMAIDTSKPKQGDVDYNTMASAVVCMTMFILLCLVDASRRLEGTKSNNTQGGTQATTSSSRGPKLNAIESPKENRTVKVTPRGSLKSSTPYNPITKKNVFPQTLTPNPEYAEKRFQSELENTQNSSNSSADQEPNDQHVPTNAAPRKSSIVSRLGKAFEKRKSQASSLFKLISKTKFSRQSIDKAPST